MPLTQGPAAKPQNLLSLGKPTGGIRPAARFDMELEDPVLGQTMSYGYAVEVLPVVS